MLDREAFGEALGERVRGAIPAVRGCALKVYQFRLHSGGKRAWAQLIFHVEGVGAEGGPVSLRARPVAELAKGADGWRFEAMEWGALEHVWTQRPWFRDVSAQVGFDLGRSALTEESIRTRTNDRSLETIGGLAVIDWDRDGRPDLLAWNRGRTLQLFRNDGGGGFEKRADLIGAAQVGLFHLFVDLDGDGREELVSSEVVACSKGVARLGLFRRDGQRFVEQPGLRFAHDCGGYQALKFQHLALADVDRDGDLDLLATGFSNRASKGARHNLFHSQDGEPNLLFINEGGLRFSEQGAARGVAGRAFTYAATFFDYDEDGDADLYAVNDYGPNALYLNDGAGRFSPAPPGPLTDNGQSMGVSLTDLDGDGDLDVYVSNMFSKAGNRIVPVVEDLQPETRETLLGLARGNSAYLREGPGRYREAATELGVVKAGWAWGQASLDVHNDGDRELYVLNGMTSHENRRAPDY